MGDQLVEQPAENRPLTFLVTKWYGYIFSSFFLLYGGVNIVLGFLDRDYTNTPKSLVFLIVGIILITTCIAFRDRKVWGWYGLVGVNGMVVIGSLIGYSEGLNLLYLVLSLICLLLLFTPRTKAEIF